MNGLLAPVLGPAGTALHIEVAPGQLLSGQFRTQYVAANIQRLVVGLYDAETGADPAPVPYLGLEVSPGPSYSTSTPSYHPAIAGQIVGGVYSAGALSFSGYSLTSAQEVDFRRYLYTTSTSTPFSDGTVAATFSNLRPSYPAGSSRYIAFAAAMDSATGASDSYVIGFASASVGDLAGGTLTVPLSLTLNREVGTVTASVSISPSTKNPLSAIQELVVGLIDTQTDLTARPETLGFRFEVPTNTTDVGSNEATYSVAPTTPSDYFSQVQNNIGSNPPLSNGSSLSTNDTMANEWPRYLWHRKSYSGSGSDVAPSTLQVQMPYVPSSPGGATDYIAYALAFKQGLTGVDSFSTLIGVATTSLSVAAGTSPTVSLPMALNTAR